MSSYHVGCGMFGIYAGTLKPNGKEWKEKSDVTDEAINAVRDYMFAEFYLPDQNKGGYEWKRKDGRIVKLLVEVTESEVRHE